MRVVGRRAITSAGALAVLSGCALVSGLDQIGTGPGIDGGGADGPSSDAPGPDGGRTDSGPADTGAGDANADTKPPDSGQPDSGQPDSGSAYPPGVYCGSYQLLCNTLQTCCKSGNMFSCGGGACAALPIDCDDWKDCGGGAKVCCADLVSNQVVAVSCQDQSSCSIGVGHQQLCDPGAVTPCANNKQCNGPAPTGLSSNYKTCQ